jgi:hypothetical protein
MEMCVYLMNISYNRKGVFTSLFIWELSVGVV